MDALNPKTEGVPIGGMLSIVVGALLGAVPQQLIAKLTPEHVQTDVALEINGGVSLLAPLDNSTIDILDEAFGTAGNSQSHSSGGTRLSMHGTSESDDLTPLRSMGEAVHNDQKVIEFAYGELPRVSFEQIFREADAKPGDKYYDLGAGEGKSVALAWAMGMQASGIELLGKRFNASCNAVEKLDKLAVPANASGKCRLMFGSFLKLDWSDADIVFTDDVMFSADTMAELSHRAKALKRGARIIAYKPFVGKDFEEVKTFPLNISWNENEKLVFHMQRKVTAANHSVLQVHGMHPALRQCCPHGSCGH